MPIIVGICGGLSRRPLPEEVVEAASARGVLIGYRSSSEISLPDFQDSFTRAVHSGQIHSLMPPRRIPYDVLCVVEYFPGEPIFEEAETDNLAYWKHIRNEFRFTLAPIISRLPV